MRHPVYTPKAIRSAKARSGFFLAKAAPQSLDTSAAVNGIQGEKQSPWGLCVVAKAVSSKPCAYSREGGPRNVGESLPVPPQTESKPANLQCTLRKYPVTHP